MSTIAAVIGRILIALLFVVSGIMKLMDPAPAAAMLSSVGSSPALVFPTALFEIIDHANLSGAVDHKTYARDLDRIAAKKLALERQEEAIICGLEAEGYQVARREGADPRALLWVEEID